MLALLLIAAAPLEMPADGWIAFDQPAVTGTERLGCGSDGKASLANDEDHWNIGDFVPPQHHDRFTLYIEMRDGEPWDVRAYTPDCVVEDAGRAQRVKLDPADAVDLLAGYLDAPRSRNFESRLIATIAHIDDKRADTTLEEIAATTSDADRSQDGLFWLAQRRGDHGRQVVTAHLESRWPLDHREQAVMALALSEHPEAVDTVRDVAREAEPAALRAQAVMALGITDAPGALADLHSIYLVDEDSEVREQVVFALSQLENEDAARVLADIIRNPDNGELRRTALFWLAQMDSDSSQEVIDALMEDVL